MIWIRNLSIAILVLAPFSVSKETTEDVAAVLELTSGENDADIILQIGPEFGGPIGSDHDDDDDNDDGDNGSESDRERNDENDGVEDDSAQRTGKADTKSTKEALAQALAASKERYKTPIQFVKNHFPKVAALAVIYVFRDALFSMIFDFFFRTTRNPKSGEIVFVFRSTSLVKALLFGSVLFQAVDSYKKNGDPVSSLVHIHPVFQIFAKIIPGLVPPVNPSYVPSEQQHYQFERINERYIKDGMALQKSLSLKHKKFMWPAPTSGKKFFMPKKAADVMLTQPSSDDVVIIMDLTNIDTYVSNIKDIRDQVSFLLSEHRKMAMYISSVAASKDADVSKVRPKLEVVVIVESPGGSASDFGYAAQQLLRLRNEPGIQLTVCVDTIAASGGYMLACTASPGRLLVAPFSVVGSIGVISQVVNIQKTLQSWGANPIVIKGGKDKAPLGVIGDVTREGRDTTQNMIDNVHRAFMRHVVEARPILKDTIDKVGTGDVWLGYDAVENGLADELSTSDEYIGRRIKEGARVVKMVKVRYDTNFWGKKYILGSGVAESLPNRIRSAGSRTVDFLSSLFLETAFGEMEQPQARLPISFLPVAKYTTK